jgi:hypothetical protein
MAENGLSHSKHQRILSTFDSPSIVMRAGSSSSFTGRSIFGVSGVAPALTAFVDKIKIVLVAPRAALIYVPLEARIVVVKAEAERKIIARNEYYRILQSVTSGDFLQLSVNSAKTRVRF